MLVARRDERAARSVGVELDPVARFESIKHRGIRDLESHRHRWHAEISQGSVVDRDALCSPFHRMHHAFGDSRGVARMAGVPARSRLDSSGSAPRGTLFAEISEENRKRN